jgi:hypothetical protein
MDKVQKHNSFNTNTPSSESYRNYLCVASQRVCIVVVVVVYFVIDSVRNLLLTPPYVTKNGLPRDRYANFKTNGECSGGICQV